jgi:hypothetical protein
MSYVPFILHMEAANGRGNMSYVRFILAQPKGHI